VPIQTGVPWFGGGPEGVLHRLNDVGGREGLDDEEAGLREGGREGGRGGACSK